MIRIGVAQWCLNAAGSGAIFQAARLGFSSMHIDVGELCSPWCLESGAAQAEYIAASRQADVEITAVSANELTIYGLTSAAGSESARKCWGLIRIAIEAAAQMGVGLVFLPSFENGEIRTGEDLCRTAEVLRQACDYAKDHAITVATENSLGVEGNLALIEAVGDPALRILLDTQNPKLWGYEPAALARELWPHLCNQIHVKDGVDGIMGNRSPGAGDSGFADTARALISLGFSGDLIVENEYEVDQEVRLMDDLAVLRSVFHQQSSGNGPEWRGVEC